MATTVATKMPFILNAAKKSMTGKRSINNFMNSHFEKEIKQCDAK
jgi:hypothetical protein